MRAAITIEFHKGGRFGSYDENRVAHVIEITADDPGILLNAVAGALSKAPDILGAAITERMEMEDEG